jgi:hypothetical protein
MLEFLFAILRYTLIVPIKFGLLYKVPSSLFVLLPNTGHQKKKICLKHTRQTQIKRILFCHVVKTSDGSLFIYIETENHFYCVLSTRLVWRCGDCIAMERNYMSIIVKIHQTHCHMYPYMLSYLP